MKTSVGLMNLSQNKKNNSPLCLVLFPKRADAELAKFANTSSVSFYALRNAHLQRAFSCLNATYKIPSDYKLKALYLQKKMRILVHRNLKS